MKQTLAEKIVQRHMTAGPDRPVRAGDVVSLKPRHVLTHDNTAAVIPKFLSIGATKVADPAQPMFALDHGIQDTSAENLAKYARIEEFAREQGIDFYPAGTGIGHQIMVTRGYVVPESLCVASDSHSNMYGALGALGTPIVRTDAAAVWATGEFWWQIPRTVKVELTGTLADGVSGKDLILALCGAFASGEALNAIVEFGGPGVASLSMDARLSVANMTTEWGALAGIFPIDAITVEFMRHVRNRIGAEGEKRFSEDDLMRWSTEALVGDDGADCAGTIRLDLTTLRPMVAGPDTVQAATTLAEMAAQQVKIDKAYLLSCVNGRLEDLQAAARVLEGKKVADHVELYVAAASQDVQDAAEADGTWQVLVDAGARILPPGCGPCIGLGTGLLEPGEVAISATNRNFKGRMGSREARAYLASPAVVAASAVAGQVVAPDGVELNGTSLEASFEDDAASNTVDERVEILEGFPATVEGRVLFVPADNLNTDGIYGKDYTYKTLAPEEMARVVMENHDPTFAGTVRPGDVLVGGINFGTGSSREQAATALKAAGVAMVIASSYSQTYLRNAYNNGFLCISCPELVDHMRATLGEAAPTLVAATPMHVDFASGRIAFDDREFRFSPLGEVPQALIVAGGLENKVRQQLAQS